MADLATSIACSRRQQNSHLRATRASLPKGFCGMDPQFKIILPSASLRFPPLPSASLRFPPLPSASLRFTKKPLEANSRSAPHQPLTASLPIPLSHFPTPPQSLTGGTGSTPSGLSLGTTACLCKHLSSRASSRLEFVNTSPSHVGRSTQTAHAANSPGPSSPAHDSRTGWNPSLQFADDAAFRDLRSLFVLRRRLELEKDHSHSRPNRHRPKTPQGSCLPARTSGPHLFTPAFTGAITCQQPGGGFRGAAPA